MSAGSTSCATACSAASKPANRVLLWYYRLLTSREGKSELIALLENLTVNETSFFRANPSSNYFRKQSWKTCCIENRRAGIGACVSGVRAARQGKSPTVWP